MKKIIRNKNCSATNLELIEETLADDLRRYHVTVISADGELTTPCKNKESADALYDVLLDFQALREEEISKVFDDEEGYHVYKIQHESALHVIAKNEDEALSRIMDSLPEDWTGFSQIELVRS